MPVVVWRVGDDAEWGVVDFHLPCREFDDDGLAPRFGHHEVNRRGDANGRLDDADDANLRERVAHFFNRPTGGEQILADIQGTECPGSLGRVIGRILSVAGMVEDIHTKPLLVHAVQDEVFVHGIQTDSTMDGFPTQAMLPIGHFGLVFMTTRNDDEP